MIAQERLLWHLAWHDLASLGEIIEVASGLNEPYEIERVACRLSVETPDENLGPVIECDMASLDSMQAAILQEWWDGEDNEWGEGEYAVLDSIKWKFGPGWRKRYPDGIPQASRETDQAQEATA